MKKLFLLATSTILLASCASDAIVEQTENGPNNVNGPISFVMQNKNMTRAGKLQDNGHYNFGVFGYKSTDVVNNIMENYLVGYYDEAKAYSKAGTTWGDPDEQIDGQSYWMYEGLGWGEFTGTYAGQRLNKGEKYASNVENQYLRYWDKAADNTYFYAYAPYVNSSTAPVKYVDGQAVESSNDTYVMTIPNGTIKHGVVEDGDDYSLYEFMYASANVAKANYGHDVALNFKRLNAKVNIKFWEDIPGYSVRIINVTDAYSVSAVPAINVDAANTTHTVGNYGYKLGKIYSVNGAKIKFNDGAENGIQQFAGTTVQTPINFKAPTAAQIGTNRIEATPSTTTYYAIPKNSAADVLKNDAIQTDQTQAVDADLALTGLTFHVSYELISTTGEVITVKDATVFVPTDYTNWQANTHYTYIFKITKNSNGTTDSADTPNPEDPEVPKEIGLYPIVFDNCTVEDWATSESEHIISGETETKAAYHDVQLSTYSIVNGTIDVTITDNDTYQGHGINYSNVTVTGPAGATGVTYAAAADNSKGVITVAAGATAGVYTVTYTCNTPAALQYNNHPATWTETFVVGNAYTVNTNLNEVGTKGLAGTKLTITTTKDNNTETTAGVSGTLEIEYPKNVVNTDRVKVVGTEVVVANNAEVGKYKLVYNITVDGAKVKVAEKKFEVKDYGLVLNKSIVELGATAVNVSATSGIAGGVITCDKSTGVTITGMNLAIANTAAEGTYTVTYTVYGNASDANHVSTVQYKQTFEVKNVYTVTLDKTTLNTTEGAANNAVYGTNFIKITSTKNGLADDLSVANVTDKYVVNGLTKGTDYTMVYVAAAGSDPAYIKLQVNKNVAAGNYTVVYTGQTTPDTKTAKAVFTVQN